MKNKDARSIPHKAREILRKKAAKAVVDLGKTQVEIANLFGVSTTAVNSWVKAYRKGGIKALETRQIGRPKGKKLSASQETKIRKIIVGKNPDQLRLPGFLWTRQSVCDLVERCFQITLSRWTLGRYMKQWGLSCQKPAKRALEQNPDNVKKWLEEDYPRICKEAKKWKASIWWGDETGLRSDHQTGTTWGEKGRTPIVRQSGMRFSCNMISAITNQGKLMFMAFTERFTTQVYIEFLERMVKQQGGQKTILIMDNHAVHKSKEAKNWLEIHEDSIRVYYLPPYSPELNPDELLNQDIKQNARRQKKAKNRKELLEQTEKFLSSRQRDPAKVSRYFEGKYVQYAKIV